MTKTIFISYGRDDKHPEDVELVLKIKNDLSKEFHVLMDIDRLKTTDDWEEKLSRDILASDWIVFFITPYSARRPDGYCLNELTYGLYKKKSIAPVMLNYVDPPLSICRIQYLDLQNLKDQTTYKEKLQEMIAVLKEEKNLGFEGNHVTILNKLDPLKFDTVIAKHIHGFVGREWVYKRVDEWLKEEVSSRVLWITAEAGYGKTALATYLSEKHPSSTSIHYCQHDAQKTKDPMQVLKTFIYELSTQVPEYHEKLSGMDIKDKLTGNAADIFRELLVEPLLKIERPDKDLFFIIDALDEAKDENGKNLIVDLIANRFSDLPEWFNIIITSRPEPEIIRKLKKFNPIELRANEEQNLEDLKLYIDHKFKKIEDEKIDALIHKSEGNMLYLKSVLESESIKDGSFSLEDIENLPQGMEALYQQFFERKFEDSNAYEDNYLNFVSILVASGEGLPIALIKYILKLKSRSFEKIKEKFASLLEENNGILTFYHKSLFDWLSDYDLSADYSADLELGHDLTITTLWELYKGTEKRDLLYHSYLLRSVYESKAYEKLNTLLQDILFIGQLYDQGEHTFYRKVLENSIETCLECESENLKIYESFFREKEHLIFKIDEEKWRLNNTLLQLAYEDGNNSPLTHQSEAIQEQNHFLRLKLINRPSHFFRSNLLKVFQGHTNAVYGVKKLSNGNLLSFSKDSTMRLWNNKGIELVVFQGHTGAINCVEILHNNLIISCSDDCTMRLWKDDGTELAIFKGHTKAVTHIIVLNHRQVLSSSKDKSLRIWNLKGETIHKIPVDSDLLQGVTQLDESRFIHYSGTQATLWNNTGEKLTTFVHQQPKDDWSFIFISGVTVIDTNIFTYTTEGEIYLWDIKGKKKIDFEGHTDFVFRVSYLNKDQIYSYSSDKTIRIWDYQGKELCCIEGHFGSVYGAIPFNNNIVSFSSDRTIRIWDSSTGKELARMTGHTEEILGIRIFDNSKIISYSKDKTIRLWSNDGECLKIFTGHSDKINGIDIIDFETLLSYSNDKTLRLWDIGNMSSSTQECLTETISGVKILSEDKLISYAKDGKLQLWNFSGVILHEFEWHTDSVSGITVINKEKFISYSKDGTLCIWNINENTNPIVLKGHEDEVNGAIVLGNGNILSYSKDNTLRVWSAQGDSIAIYDDEAFPDAHYALDMIIIHNGNILSYYYDGYLKLRNPEGKYLAFLSGERIENIHKIELFGNNKVLLYCSPTLGDNNIQIWDLTGKEIAILKGHTQGINGIKVLNNKQILSYSSDRTIRLWNEEGKCLKIFNGHSDSIRGIIVYEDNILSYSYDGTMILWNLDGRILAEFKGHSDYVIHARFHNSELILSSSNDNTLRLWNIHGEQLNIIYFPFDKAVLYRVTSDRLILGNGEQLFFYEFDLNSFTNFKPTELIQMEKIPN